jgi:hypothetical protein
LLSGWLCGDRVTGGGLRSPDGRRKSRKHQHNDERPFSRVHGVNVAQEKQQIVEVGTGGTHFGHEA